MIVTRFEHTSDTIGSRVDVDLSRPLPRSVPKEDLPLWSLTKFSGPRCIANAIEVDGLTYDVDAAPIPNLPSIRNAVVGVSGIVAVSSSATLAQPRWRLKLDVDKPIPAKDYKRISTHVASLLPFPVATNSLEPARMWYMPREPEEGPYVFEILEGEPLKLDELLASANTTAFERSIVNAPPPPTLSPEELARHITAFEEYCLHTQDNGREVAARARCLELPIDVAGDIIERVYAPRVLVEPAPENRKEWPRHNIDWKLEQVYGGTLLADMVFGPGARRMPPAGFSDHLRGQTAPLPSGAVSGAIPVTNGVATATNGATPGPTLDNPLQGLEHLSRVAVVGRDKIVELSERPVVWLWEGIASAGLTILLAAAPSSGKTTLLFLLIAARLNRGEPIHVLGHEVLPAPADKWIVVIEAEHSDESASRILRKSLLMQGISEEALNRVILVARGGVRLGSPAWSDVENLISRGLVSDVVLDTLARVAPDGDEANAESSQVDVFDDIAKTIELAPSAEDRPTFWVAAHLRKCEGVPTLNDVSGSNQRVGQPDAVLLMGATRSDQKVKSVTCYFGKVREKDPEDWPVPVEYVVSKKGIVVVETPETDERPLKEQIVTRLELGVPLTKNALKTKLGRNTQDLEAALTELFKERRIDKATVRKNGKEWVAYILRPGATAESRERAANLSVNLARIKAIRDAELAAATAKVPSDAVSTENEAPKQPTGGIAL